MNYYEDIVKSIENAKMPPVYAVETEHDLPMDVPYGSIAYCSITNKQYVFTGVWTLLSPAIGYHRLVPVNINKGNIGDRPIINVYKENINDETKDDISKSNKIDDILNRALN